MILIIIGLFIFWAIFAILMFQNREAEKFWETIIVVTIVMIGALFFVLKEDKIEENFIALYFYNEKKNDLLEFPILTIHMNEAMLWGYHEKDNTTKQKKKISQEIFQPLLEKTIIDWFRTYGAWGYTSLRGPSASLIRHTGISTGNAFKTKEKSKKIDQKEIQKILQGNMFSNYEIGLSSMTVPQGMEVKVERDEHTSKIILENKFCRISISIFISGRHIIQEHMDIAKFLKLNKRKIEGTYVVFVDFRNIAVFKKWYAGHPEMKNYKTWAKDKLCKIKDDFGWEPKRKMLFDQMLVDLSLSKTSK